MEQLQSLKETDNLRGNLSPEEQIALISVSTSMKECLKGAFYVQECVPEDLALKKKVWKQIDEAYDGEKCQILASSVSCMIPDDICEHLQEKAKRMFIVAHPVNPPYFVPLVELVPTTWTSAETRAETRRIMEEIGQKPVSINKALPGFVLNRIQYAIINESLNLIMDGILSPEDLDVVVKDGLGMRYAFMGPMETIHLNAQRGFKHYVDLYGDTIQTVSKSLKPYPSEWSPKNDEEKERLEKVRQKMEAFIPMEEFEERKNKRDQALAELAKLKKRL